jgi:hypothetical protein
MASALLWPAGRDAAQEIVWYVKAKAFNVPQELERFEVSFLLDSENVANVRPSRKGRNLANQLGSQVRIGIFFPIFVGYR